MLAWHNVNGATKGELKRAVSLIEAAGPAEDYVQQLATRGLPLYAMSRVERLALEMAVNDQAEHSRLAARAARYEAEWRRADELATIIEEEIQPEEDSDLAGLIMIAVITLTGAALYIVFSSLW